MPSVDIEKLKILCEAATAGPWFVRRIYDPEGLEMVVIDTVTTHGHDLAEFAQSDSAHIVAATLIQSPSYVRVHDGRWLENAELVSIARSAIPELIDEIILRGELDQDSVRRVAAIPRLEGNVGDDVQAGGAGSFSSENDFISTGYEDLDRIFSLCARATPGPWFPTLLDNSQAMNLVAVSVRDETV